MIIRINPDVSMKALQKANLEIQNYLQNFYVKGRQSIPGKLLLEEGEGEEKRLQYICFCNIPHKVLNIIRVLVLKKVKESNNCSYLIHTIILIQNFNFKFSFLGTFFDNLFVLNWGKITKNLSWKRTNGTEVSNLK